MKNFNKINGVLVEIVYPEEYGNPSNVVDKKSKETLHDMLWHAMDSQLRSISSVNILDLPLIEDKTNGFNTCSVTLFISVLKDIEQLDRTIEWCENVIKHAYSMLTKHQRRLAKSREG